MYQLRFQVLLRYTDDLAWGLALSLSLSFTSLLLGSALGLALAFARSFGNEWIKKVVDSYVEFFRNIPLLLIIIFIFFGLPLMDVRILDKYYSVIVAMSLYASAYLTEIFRAGIESVESRYLEAGRSIGLSTAGLARYIIGPLMFAEILPALGNFAISLFKDSSLATAAAVPELTFVGRKINTDTWRVVEAWTAVAGVYLGVSYALAFLLRNIERRVIAWR